jgi:hypothetical protein
LAAAPAPPRTCRSTPATQRGHMRRQDPWW